MGIDILDSVELTIRHPVHRVAYAYWKSRSNAAGGLASRSEIDPAEIPSILPWVNLIDVHPTKSGVRYRHRLVGTGIVSVHERDSTGLWFDELYDSQRLARLARTLDAVVGDGHPRLIRDDLAYCGKPHWRHETLVLPLASDHCSVDMLLGISHYE